MTELPGGSWTAYFDSCMREDCNGVVYQALSVCHAISIHACTRIATLLLGGSVIEQTISIHACARIATLYPIRRIRAVGILIHARVRIATVILYKFFP